MIGRKIFVLLGAVVVPIIVPVVAALSSLLPVPAKAEESPQNTAAPATEETPKEKTEAKKADPKSGKKTDMRFDELLVQGKYHFNDEAVVTVEEDKVLDALLGTRTDFKDRIKKSAARH